MGWSVAAAALARQPCPEESGVAGQGDVAAAVWRGCHRSALSATRMQRTGELPPRMRCSCRRGALLAGMPRDVVLPLRLWHGCHQRALLVVGMARDAVWPLQPWRGCRRRALPDTGMKRGGALPLRLWRGC